MTYIRGSDLNVKKKKAKLYKEVQMSGAGVGVEGEEGGGPQPGWLAL